MTGRHIELKKKARQRHPAFFGKSGNADQLFGKVRYLCRTILEKSGNLDPVFRGETGHFQAGLFLKSSCVTPDFFEKVQYR